MCLLSCCSSPATKGSSSLGFVQENPQIYFLTTQVAPVPAQAPNTFYHSSQARTDTEGNIFDPSIDILPIGIIETLHFTIHDTPPILSKIGNDIATSALKGLYGWRGPLLSLR